MSELDELFNASLPVYDDDLGPEAATVIRDRYGRPVIEGKPHTRVSTLVNMLNDHSGIHTWEKRLTVLGMGRDYRLQERASALPDIYDTSQDKSVLTPQQRADDQATKQALDVIADEAMETAGRLTKAWYGTAFHGHTDPDGSEKQVPPSMRRDVAAYRHETVAIEQVRTEPFMWCPTLRAAGTPDGFYRVPGYGVVVGDKKTGIFDPVKFIVQMATYANSVFYAEYEKEHKNIEPGDIWEDYNPDWGIVFHSPRHAGETKMYVVNLKKGWEGAQLAAQVRDWRENTKKKDVATLLTRDATLEPLRAVLADSIEGCVSREDVIALRKEHLSVWTDELDAACKLRLANISGAQ